MCNNCVLQKARACSLTEDGTEDAGDASGDAEGDEGENTGQNRGDAVPAFVAFAIEFP